MKLLARALSRLGYISTLSRVKSVEIDPPDLLIYYPGLVVLSRFLICRDVEYDMEELMGERSKVALESYAALLRSLPSKVYLYLYKDEFDATTFLRKLKNTILNLQAELELASEETERVKLKIKLEKLKSLYTAVIEGKPFIKIALALVFRVEGKDRNAVKSIADYHEHVIATVFRNHLGLKLERAGVNDILALTLSVLGIEAEPGIPGVNLEVNRLSTLHPVALDKPLLAEPGVLLGYEKDTVHPVSLQFKHLYHHTIVMGPTGRGKSTLLASFVEQVVSEGYSDIIVVDFKGDLKRYIADNLLPILTPNKAMISLVKPPPGIELMSWRTVVVEAISHSGSVNPETVLGALIIVEKSAESIFQDPSASALIPFVEFISTGTDYGWVEEYLARGEVKVLFDLEERGTVFQNTYASLLIGILRHLLLGRQREKGLLLVVDDAWRILRLKTLAEIVREGRSRKVGVVLSSQNPEDYPSEILENTYNMIVFGSRSEDYVDKVRRIIGLDKQLVSVLPRLSTGEAVYVNMSTKSAKVISVYLPSKAREKRHRGVDISPEHNYYSPRK